MFKSLDEVKAVSEKFEAGKIIPARIIKGVDKKSRKAACYLKFSIDVYRLNGVFGSVLVCDLSGKNINYFAELLGKHDGLTFTGNPYGNGPNFFIGNCGRSDDEFLVDINQRVFGKTAVEV